MAKFAYAAGVNNTVSAIGQASPGNFGGKGPNYGVFDTITASIRANATGGTATISVSDGANTLFTQSIQVPANICKMVHLTYPHGLRAQEFGNSLQVDVTLVNASAIRTFFTYHFEHGNIG